MSSILRQPDVLARTGLKKSQLAEAIKDGRFPAPVQILEGGRAKGWISTEVDDYVESRRKARDAAATATPPKPSTIEVAVATPKRKRQGRR